MMYKCLDLNLNSATSRVLNTAGGMVVFLAKLHMTAHHIYPFILSLGPVVLKYLI